VRPLYGAEDAGGIDRGLPGFFRALCRSIRVNKNGAKLLFAYAKEMVPKITIIAVWLCRCL
jgi:hypothetical protein